MKFVPRVQSIFKISVIAAIGLIIALGAASTYAFLSLTREEPEIKKVSDYRPLGVTQVISIENGQSKIMAEFFKERRYLVPYDQIPPKLIHAFLSAEDSTFFEHQGVNFVAILRAAIANFLAGQVVQGGSTITQQIAKSLYLSPERNLLRKIKELMLAFQLEKNFSKEDILYLYLNQIYLGSGAYGVQAAAHNYFHKDVKKLTIAEMALIAGLPTAPGKYSPLLNPKKAKERQLYVLKRMKENKYITEAEQKASSAEKIKVFVNDGTEKNLAPHFVEHIRRHLAQKYGEKALYEEAMTVVVPAAAKYYNYATEALESGLEDYDQRKGFRGPIKNVPENQWAALKEELKKDLTKEYFPFRFLTPDGRLNLEEAITDYDPTFEKTFNGKRMKALIVQISPDKKTAVAHIGLSTVELPFDGVKWAFPFGKSSKTPKTVSDVLSVGDLVWIKTTHYSKEGWKGRLIQIPEVEGAIYSVDLQTGQVLAMVGGYDYERSQFNRAVQAKRQMGSTFKPIIYSAAMEHGYTPATIIVDSPVVFQDSENGTWKPENYEEKFYGDTTFRQALIESRNVPTVKIVQDIKVQTVINQAKRMGLDGPFNSDLSIALGSGATSLQDLVHAYTAFPLQGKAFRAVLFDKILDRDGRIVETSKDISDDSKEGKEAKEAKADAATPTNTPAQGNYAPVLPGLRLDPRVAYVMTHLMKEVVEFGTAARANSMGRPIAGKTGTNQDFRDAWFMGFSPQVVTGVWVGFDDQRSLGHGETGANVALPIWMKFMQNTLKDYPTDDFPVPEGVTFVNIDNKTGKKSEGSHTIHEAFVTGTEPGFKAEDLRDPEEAAQPGAKPQVKAIDNTDDETLREDQ